MQFGAHLGVLELLLHVPDRRPAPLTDKAPTDQLRPDLGRPRDRPANTHELADSVHPEISDARSERQVVERDTELASSQRRGRGTRCSGEGRGGVEVGGFVSSDQRLKRSSKVREKSGQRLSIKTLA